MVEASIVTLNNHIIDYSVGNACSVEFNFEKIWKEYSTYHLGLLQFYHVHPCGCLDFSIKDKNCIKGFYQAFKCKFNFFVIVFDNEDLFSIHNSCIGSNENFEIIDLLNLDYHITNDQLLFLKYLSYGGNK